MKIRWSQVLGVVLPVAGIAIEIWDGINQTKLQEEEMAEFEANLVAKYGLNQVQDGGAADEN